MNVHLRSRVAQATPRQPVPIAGASGRSDQRKQFQSAAASADMPPTKEIRCTSEDCFLDMFENHYTYDVPEDHGIEDLQCPVCGGTDCLELIEL